MSTELRHYGVPGMKWGVRRYQNKDGSYTAAGKSRRSKPIAINDLDRKQLLDLSYSGDDFAVKKGSKVYRTTTNKRDLNAKKSVVLNPKEEDTFLQRVNDYPDDPTESFSNHLYKDTYSTTKDLKVAGAKTQRAILQDIYGKKYTEDNLDILGVLNQPLSNPDTAKYVEKLSSKGYDAAVDLLETEYGEMLTRTLVFKSKDSLKRESREKQY